MQGLDWCEFVNQYCDHFALHVKPVNLRCKSIDSLALSWWASSGGLIITVLHIEWGLCSDIVEAQCKLVLKWDACKAETSKVELAKTGAFWCEGIFSCDGWVSWNGPSKLVNQSTSPSNPVNWSTGPPHTVNVNKSIGPHHPIDWFLIMFSDKEARRCKQNESIPALETICLV